MNLEKLTTLPEPLESKAQIPETKSPNNPEDKTQEGSSATFQETNSEKTSNKTETFLSSDNQDFFRKMSNGGTKIADQIFEGLYKIPVVDRLVGKYEIAYNQFWVDRHEEKAVKLKNQIDSLNLKIGLFVQSKQEIESVMEDLKQQNAPGIESLQLKLKDIEKQRIDLLNEKDRVQSKFEAKENRIKLHANERDMVADKLIGIYNEKLQPMEKELEGLRLLKDENELFAAVMEVNHKEQLVKLEDLNKKKTQIEESLRRVGMSEKDIRKFEAVKMLSSVIVRGYENIKIEKENLVQGNAGINRQIGETDARANLYRDNREEFVRVKTKRPITIEVEARTRSEEFKGEEEVSAHPRKEAQETFETREEQSTTGTMPESATETVKENKERLEAPAYISMWNAYLVEKYGKNIADVSIDGNEFLKKTGLSKNGKLDFKDFKNILGKYYKVKRLSLDKFNKSIDEFFNKKIKTHQ